MTPHPNPNPLDAAPPAAWRAHAALALDEPASKLLKLCARFARNAQVDHVRGTPHGSIVFPWGGRCRLDADAAQLHFVCEAADEPLLERTCGVIERHLALFARGTAGASAAAVAPSWVRERAA